MKVMGFRGGNCTYPHKQAILPLLGRLTPSAELAGAVNCLLRDESGFLGENTEGRALVASLRRRIDPAGQRVVLLGAGLMARAVAVELALAKAAEIMVVNRSGPAGQQIVDLLGRLHTPASLATWQGDFLLPAETQVVIHATSMPGDGPLPLGLDDLGPETVVADVAFNPQRTWLLEQARGRGMATIDGLEVFIEQTAINFRLWTNLEPERAVLREAAEEFLEL
jgi:shikimate dehydrogenase